MLKLFDRVPAEGDTIQDDHFTFTVRRMKGRRILVLLVERRGAAEAIGPGMKDDPAEGQLPSNRAGRKEG